jgi:hypothetical protein
MTEAQRQSALQRISALKNRNLNIYAIMHVNELSNGATEELYKIIEENQVSINQLEKLTTTHYEFLFNFIGGGWNSEYAHTLEEAQSIAVGKYTNQVDLNSFRVSTPADYNNLLSLFY